MAVLADRAPPELEPGVTLDSLVTIEDCDVALDRMTVSIASIEEQLARTPKGSPAVPPDWRPRAETALRIKKLLLPRLQQRRAEILRRDRQQSNAATVEAGRRARLTKDRAILSVAREMAPDVMARATQAAVERHPEIFAGEAG